MCIQWILRKGANKARRDEAAKVATSPMGALNLTTRSMSNPDHASSPETNPCWLTRYQVLVPSLLCPPSSTRHICFFFVLHFFLYIHICIISCVFLFYVVLWFYILVLLNSLLLNIVYVYVYFSSWYVCSSSLVYLTSL